MGLGEDYCDWMFSSYNSYFSRDDLHPSHDLLLDWIGGIEEFEKTHVDFKEHFDHGDRELSNISFDA